MFQSKRGTVSGYFLAGRFMTFLPVSNFSQIFKMNDDISR